MWWKKIVLLGLPMLLVLACGSDSDEPFTIGAMDALPSAQVIHSDLTTEPL